MDYKKIYDQICDRAKKESDVRIERRKAWIVSKGLDGDYYESHHIIPKCMGGTGKAHQWNHENIALLTAREHFLCHWLLYRSNPENRSLLYAFDKMCVISNTQINKRAIPSSRVIKEILEAKKRLGRDDHFKKIMSSKFRGKKRSTIVCPHCKKEGGVGNMERWHFDNCIKKPGNEGIKRTIIVKNLVPIVECPHCHKKGRQNLMTYWHFDNCPIKIGNNEIRKTLECPNCGKSGYKSAMKRWHFDNCKSLQK